MQEALRNLPRRAAAAIALLILAAACNDPLPTAVPPAVDTAELERATERVQAAAAQLDGTAERLETHIHRQYVIYLTWCGWEIGRNLKAYFL